MYDVIIIGAGLAGSYLSKRLKDLDILVIEKERKVVPRDSGIVSTRFDNLFGKKFIKDEIKEMKLISQNSSFFLTSDRTFAYVLEREKLLKDLRKTNIKYEAAKNVSINKDKVTVTTVNGEYQGKIVVGADGANSAVKRALSIKQTKIFLGIMERTRKIEQETISVYFNKNYSREFFAWVIPQNGEYGLITSSKAKEHLDTFRKYMSLPPGDIHAYPVPINYTKSFGQRALLLGDACGQVKPLTGGGIIFSMRAAQIAEKTIREALKKNLFNERFLSRYERGWKNEFGHEIKKQLIIRNVYSKLRNNDIEKIFRDFGPSIEKISEFDYDHFTNIWPKLPKIKLVKFAIKKFPLLF